MRVRQQTMPKQTRSSNALMSQRIFLRLEEDIVARNRLPGTRLVEETIAAELGVSRTPVREAIGMLHRAGWVVLQPHAGAYVRVPSLDEVRDVFDVRQALEREAAQYAAGRADEDDLRALDDVVERGLRGKGLSDRRAMVDLNSEFHRRIALAAHNAILLRFLEELDKQIRWYFAAVVDSRLDASWTEHRQIVEAIATGDVDEAGRRSAEHSRRTQIAYVEQFLTGTGLVRS
jgi:DNA-binding GntR family transcriptional regulator